MLNPATPVDTIQHIIADIDMVLLMSVNPGFGGQTFIPEVLPKIKKVKEMAEEKGIEIEIEIDGGVNRETAKLCMEAGANVLVAGSAIYNQEDTQRDIVNKRLKSTKPAKMLAFSLCNKESTLNAY